MSETMLGKQITTKTRRGLLHGKVVGTEDKDTTRNGSGRTVPHVCIAPSNGGNWIWLPADSVEAVPADVPVEVTAEPHPFELAGASW